MSERLSSPSSARERARLSYRIRHCERRSPLWRGRPARRWLPIPRSPPSARRRAMCGRSLYHCPHRGMIEERCRAGARARPYRCPNRPSALRSQRSTPPTSATAAKTWNSRDGWRRRWRRIALRRRWSASPALASRARSAGKSACDFFDWKSAPAMAAFAASRPVTATGGS